MKNGTDRKKKAPKSRSNLILQDGYYAELLISAVITGIVGYALWKRGLRPFYASAVPNWILIAALFFAVTFMHVLLVGLLERLLKKIYPLEEPLEIGRVLLFAFCGSLIVGVLAGFLEFVYELDFNKMPMPVPKGGVVYVIDDSGSMYGTDPQNKRNQCVVKMNDYFPESAVSGLVRFSERVDTYLDIAQMSEDHKNLMELYAMKEASGGGTNIESGIDQALDMCETSPAVTEAPEMPHILLLTDGQSQCNVNAVVQRCLSDGIKIDAISLGIGTDIGLLRNLTSGTGGTLASVPDAFYLEGAFKILTGQEVKRCLLTPVLLIRDNRNSLKVMQVIFLFLIGLALEGVVTLMLAYARYVRPHAIKSPFSIFAGAVLVMVSDASLVSVLIMLGCFLLPFFVGREFQGFVKKQWIVDHRPMFGYGAGRIGKTDTHFYCNK